MGQKRQIELKDCPNCGGKPEVKEVKMDSIWKKGSFFIAYKVECKCGRCTVISGSENMVRYYWNTDQYMKKT